MGAVPGPPEVDRGKDDGGDEGDIELLQSISGCIPPGAEGAGAGSAHAGVAFGAGQRYGRVGERAGEEVSILVILFVRTFRLRSDRWVYMEPMLLP